MLDLKREAALQNNRIAWRGFFEVLFWSRGKETAIWQMIDKAESLLTYTWKRDELLVRLRSAMARLQIRESPFLFRQSVAISNADKMDDVNSRGG